MSNRHRVEPCPTVALEVNGRIEHLDAGIAPLVAVLNDISCVETYTSCEGHPWSPCDTRAYVAFGYQGVDLELRIWPDVIPDLVAALVRDKPR